MMVITGPTGSGKSYSALTLAKALDPNFKIEQVVYTPEEFLELCKAENRLPKGSVVVFDEVGVGLSNREFFSKGNRNLNKVLETFRVYNYIVIFTTPSFSFIDSKARRLMHAVGETQFINRNRKYVKLNFGQLHIDPMTGNTEYRRFKKYQDNGLKSVPSLEVVLPPKDLIKAKTGDV